MNAKMVGYISGMVQHGISMGKFVPRRAWQPDKLQPIGIPPSDPRGMHTCIGQHVHLHMQEDEAQTRTQPALKQLQRIISTEPASIDHQPEQHSHTPAGPAPTAFFSLATAAHRML